MSETGATAEEPGYEQARDELARVVAALEAGGLSLEDSLALWERGEALARLCERHLAGARERVEAALERASGDGAERSSTRGTGDGADDTSGVDPSK